MRILWQCAIPKWGSEGYRWSPQAIADVVASDHRASSVMVIRVISSWLNLPSA